MNGEIGTRMKRCFASVEPSTKSTDAGVVALWVWLELVVIYCRLIRRLGSSARRSGQVT